ncbi:hypothetical protein [Lysinibacillus pakistanensis]|uniref:Lipoprotein n=1 Tax=Lysinibacillus pakistanensis TaxID=759811 RepID=A0AAX3X536_9BACI|nr:hypothetical protein [Lysinibacillus pakistanensis]MDM5233537.1 hypothetical protein [Lysinibacillus pakistanensis]WHY49008.1 hypothetical protein QNH22_12520 [Lysinibacillus pakistanensis]WHY54019.1 hypothetical protein QNH24_12500 [Lysinibacillus pakistanensis]
MKKFLYIGAMSAFLLAACGEEKAEETETAQEELDKAKEKEAELKAKEEEERKAKEVEEWAIAEQKSKEEEVEKKEPTTAEKSKHIIDTSVFEYAQAVNV